MEVENHISSSFSQQPDGLKNTYILHICLLQYEITQKSKRILKSYFETFHAYLRMLKANTKSHVNHEM